MPKAVAECGYLMPLRPLREVVLNRDQFDEAVSDAMESGDWSDVAQQLHNFNVKVLDVLVFNDEDDVEEGLEHGEPYAVFDVDDIYESKLTPMAERVKALTGSEPSLRAWGRFA